MTTGVKKNEATHVDVILYHHDVLAEDDDSEAEDGWEVISINGRDTPWDQPIHPETLMYNHFYQDGGTKTLMSDAEFTDQMRASFLYWKDKALLVGEFTHWTISDEELIKRIHQAIIVDDVSPGYREGVAVVSINVNPGEFFTPVCTLVVGDKLSGEFKPRIPGEVPRKLIGLRLRK